MRKIFNKSIVFAMITILVFLYIFPILSFAESPFKTYLALGDSIAYGYGLQNKDVESYAARVKEKYQINSSNFKNLAVSGMTCAEFYQIIQTKEYTDAIESADLLTVSIGSNELLGIVTKAVSMVTEIPSDDPEFLIKAQEKFIKAGALEKMRMLTAIYNYFTSEESKVEIENAIKSYGENWNNAVLYIQQKNPRITIVATEFYNPYYEFSLGSYDLGGFVDENIQKLNQILTTRSNQEKDYKIAKIYSAFNTTNPRLTNVSIATQQFNLDPHPNIAGHEIICTKILDALSDVEQEKINIEALTFSNIPDQVYTGQSITPEITIKNQEMSLVKDQDYTITYLDNIEIGEAKLIINGIGKYEGRVIKTFQIKDKERKEISEVTINNIEDKVYTGIKVIPDVEIMDGNQKLKKDVDYELKYENNIDVGKATIYISGIGNYKGRKSTTFNIIEKNINAVNIEEIPNQPYTGQEIKPSISVADGSAKLLEDKDYTISYKDNTEIGQATITVTGKGNYNGSITKNFTIVEKNEEVKKDISQLEVTGIEDKIYTGKLITPEVRIKDENTVLRKNVDYLLSYSNNIDVGVGKCTITGMGNYSGTLEKEFKIIQKDIKDTLIADIIDQEYTGKKIEPEVVISSDGIKLKKGEDYTLVYEENKIGTNKIQIEGKGNYKGTTVKTFNIVKKGEEPKKDEDPTVSHKKIPFAGGKTIMIILSVTVILAIILFLLYKKIPNIK